VRQQERESWVMERRRYMYMYMYVYTYTHTYIHIRGEEEERRRGWSRAVALERSLLNCSLVLKYLTLGTKVSTGSAVPMNTQIHHTFVFIYLFFPLLAPCCSSENIPLKKKWITLESILPGLST
jgi:hypothetical protein